MKNQSIKYKFLILTTLLLAVAFIGNDVLASSGGGPPVLPPPPAGVPIDGGLTLLLAGLGAYGAKKLLKKDN